METRIALVLGSGGARGLAHIGVIRCLTERGFRIDYIAGCSMGALVGGIYAAGKLDEFQDWVLALDRTSVLRLLDWSFSHGAIFRGERIIAELKHLIGDVDIDDLDIGFTAVATDLNGPREVWFSRGSLWDAVRASIAVPLVFAPVQDGGRTLVDGGLVNPTFNSRAHSPELVIEVPRGLATFFEFYRARELIDAGYARTAALLDRNRDD